MARHVRLVQTAAERRGSLTTTAEQARAEGLFMEAVEEMPDEYLSCMDMTHPWEVVRDYHLVDAERDVSVQPRMGETVYVRRLSRCPRCGKKRNEAFFKPSSERRGLVSINATYDDPPGFAVKGIGHMAGRKALVRGEAFNRVMAKLDTNAKRRSS